MATLSVAARNAALTAVISFLETGVVQARPSLRSVDAGAVTINNTFLAISAPPGQVFNAPSGGVATKTTLPWLMAVSTVTPRTLASWEIRSQANVPEIFGTYGGPGSGADIEMADAELTVRQGNNIQLLTFALAMA